MARPIVHHRSPEFEAVFARVREGLAWLYQTKQDVLVFAASAPGAMEPPSSTSCARAIPPWWSTAASSANAGASSPRRTASTRSPQVRVGPPVEPPAVEKALRDNPQAKAVYVQANESSTGVYHPFASSRR